jgi:hemerythrin-like metal-binding protein
MPIQWRETMSVDRGPIDRDHRHLIGIINEFEGVAAQPAALRQMLGLLDKLDEYARQHFSREEEFQRSVSYPLHENHYLEHQRLVHELARIRSEFEAVQDGRIVAAHARLAGLLRRWLVNHVVKLDLGMRPYVDASGAGHVMAPHRTSSGFSSLMTDSPSCATQCFRFCGSSAAPSISRRRRTATGRCIWKAGFRRN